MVFANILEFYAMFGKVTPLECVWDPINIQHSPTGEIKKGMYLNISKFCVYTF